MELVLVIPDLDKEMRIDVYASDFAIRRVLLIKWEDEWKLVVYISKLLNESKINYEIHNKYKQIINIGVLHDSLEVKSETE